MEGLVQALPHTLPIDDLPPSRFREHKIVRRIFTKHEKVTRELQEKLGSSHIPSQRHNADLFGMTNAASKSASLAHDNSIDIHFVLPASHEKQTPFLIGIVLRQKSSESSNSSGS